MLNGENERIRIGRIHPKTIRAHFLYIQYFDTKTERFECGLAARRTSRLNSTSN